MKRALIIIASMLLAFGAAAETAGDSRGVPVLSLCKDGKLIGIQLIAPTPDIYTIPIPPDVCAPKRSPPPPPRAPASKPARTV